MYIMIKFMIKYTVPGPRPRCFNKQYTVIVLSYFPGYFSLRLSTNATVKVHQEMSQCIPSCFHSIDLYVRHDFCFQITTQIQTNSKLKVKIHIITHCHPPDVYSYCRIMANPPSSSNQLHDLVQDSCIKMQQQQGCQTIFFHNPYSLLLLFVMHVTRATIN